MLCRIFKTIAITIGVIFLLGIVALFFLPQILPLGPGYQDFSYNVSGGYELLRTSSHTIHVSPQGGWADTVLRIPEKVVEIGWNKKFIIAKQQGLEDRSPDNPNDNYMQTVEGKYFYWIMSHEPHELYGPLGFAKFQDLRESLGVPAELELKDIYEYKKWWH